jgi:MYXO-CTERM domain-containing protein
MISAGWRKFSAMLLVAAGICVGNVSTATALDPESSSIDSSITIGPDGAFVSVVDESPEEELIGREKCVDNWNSEAQIRMSFNFTQPVAFENCTGRVACVDKIMFFAVPIDETPTDFSCDFGGTENCVNLDNLEDVFTIEKPSDLTDNFDVVIDYRDMVDEAVVELDDANNVAPIQSVEDCTLEGDASINQQYFVRVLLKNLGVDFDQEEMTDALIEIDTLRPEGPVEVSSVTVTEGNIFATWVQEDTSRIGDYVIFWSETDFSELSAAEIEASPDIESEVVQLDNPEPDGDVYSGDVTIDGGAGGEDARLFVAVSSRDIAENVSPPTFPGAAADPEGDGFQVVPVIDFWEHYQAAGGGEDGGCSVAPGGRSVPVGWLVVFAGFGLLSLRRRSLLGALLVFGALVAASPGAFAQSERYGIAEIRLGAYYPAVDEEEGLSGQPFHDIFGDGHRVLFGYEQGVHLFEGFGALGLSGSVGYTNFGGDVIVDESALDAAAAESAQSVSAQTEFMIIPLALSVYYRFDLLEKLWSIPLVPVVKGGVDYALWTIDASNGETATFEGEDGDGATAGWHVAGALHLWLDWIEPQSAAAFDRTWGINNTYLFAEFSHRRIDDFGSADSFNLSDDLWLFGLAFEY